MLFFPSSFFGGQFFSFLLLFCVGGGEQGKTHERPGTDQVISGPMRGLEKKTAPDGANKHPDIQTWQLFDLIGPVGPIQ